MPAQVGGFSWLSNTDVYWRTQTYLKAGSKVTVNAKVYGKNLGNSLYGQSDVSTWFMVGHKHVSIADDNTKQVLVYDNDKLVHAGCPPRWAGTPAFRVTTASRSTCAPTPARTWWWTARRTST